MPRKQSKSGEAVPAATAYEEERIPFDAVLRKLVSTPPMHKTAKPEQKTINAPKPKKG